MLGGPIIGGNWVSVDLRLTDSNRLKSSTYFFFSVFFKSWHGGGGSSKMGSGSGPTRCRGSILGIGQGEPAKFTCKSKRSTVRTPPCGPPPGMY